MGPTGEDLLKTAYPGKGLKHEESLNNGAWLALGQS
jgi:hypothetical protein